MNIRLICPESRSGSASASALYGAWSMSTPVSTLNSSAARWLEVPMPDEEYVSLPGLRLAYATSSLIDLTGNDGGTTTIIGTSQQPLTGTRSFRGAKGLLRWSA